MRKDTCRLPAAPYAQSATFALSWHKLLFDHFKIQVYKQRILSHYRIATCLLKLSDLASFTGSYIIQLPLLDVAKSAILGHIELRLEFSYNVSQGIDSPTTSLAIDSLIPSMSSNVDSLSSDMASMSPLSPTMHHTPSENTLPRSNSIASLSFSSHSNSSLAHSSLSRSITSSPAHSSLSRSITSPSFSLHNSSFSLHNSAHSQNSSFSQSTKSKSTLSMFSEKTRSGFKELSELLAAFSSTGWNKISKTDFARGLLFLQEYYKQNPKHRTNRAVANIQQLKTAAYFMHFCLPTYGAIALNYFGYGNGLLDFLKTRPDLKAAIDHLKISPSDILVWQYGNPELYKSNFFACHDKTTNSIIIAIRGTFNFHESLLDTQIEYEPILGGHGHKGWVNAALVLEQEYLEKIISWIKQRNVSSLYIVGHSLGAAIGAIFMLKTRQTIFSTFGPSFTYKAYNFATPPCLSHDLILGTEEFIETYNNENDVVPTLSFGAIMDLKSLIVKSAELVQNRQLSKPEKLDALSAFKKELRISDKHPRLYAPGKTFYMYKTSRVYHHTSKGSFSKGLVYKTGNPLIDGDAHYVVEESAPEWFEDVEVRPNLIWHHLLNKYDASLCKAHDWLAGYLDVGGVVGRGLEPMVPEVVPTLQEPVPATPQEAIPTTPIQEAIHDIATPQGGIPTTPIQEAIHDIATPQGGIPTTPIQEAIHDIATPQGGIPTTPIQEAIHDIATPQGGIPTTPTTSISSKSWDQKDDLMDVSAQVDEFLQSLGSELLSASVAENQVLLTALH